MLVGLLGIPLRFASRRREMRLRSRQGAWGWAIVDGYSVWLLLTCILIGMWTGRRFFPGHAYWSTLAGVAAGIALLHLTCPPLTSRIMKVIGG